MPVQGFAEGVPRGAVVADGDPPDVFATQLLDAVTASGSGPEWRLMPMALCMAVVAIAGVFLAIRSNFDPFMGPGRLIFGFEAVIIGGLGNLWGTLAGGIILGVAQAIGAEINPGWQILAGHLAFILVLAIRPKGLFPRIEG